MKILFFLFLCGLSLAAQTVPRPEFPQPQFERKDWQSLNGQWGFGYDGKSFDKKITVPFAVETKLSGIGDTEFHSEVWYRRSIQIPAEWKGKRVLLKFGAVDYIATVWVNGTQVATHVGGSTPFDADITDALKPGANEIKVRAVDPPTDRYVPRGKQYWEPKSKGIFYTRTTGIWQSVWLEATGESYLKRVRITAGMDGTARFDARISRHQKDLKLVAIVKTGAETLSRGEAVALDERPSTSVVIAQPKLWGPGSPNLYDVEFQLLKGNQVVDRVQSYFGFRTISIENDKFMINGRPVFLKTVLDQGYWPESTLTPPTDAAIRFDIEQMIAMGFNGERKHQKLEDPRFLYWADKMGFLVSSEAANAYLFDEEYVARFTQEWVESVERDASHPSIVMWIPVNESWGVPNLYDARQSAHLKAMYWLTKSLDPTRPVIDNDGWEHTDVTDLFGIHDYARNGDVLISKYKNLGGAGSPFPRNGREAMAPGFAYNGSPVFLSEFGGISYITPGSNVPSDAWGYAGVEPNQEAAFARLKSLWEGIVKLPRIMAICYTQLTDVEQEINGLMTYDRKMKFDPAKIKKLNDMLVPR